MSNTISSSLLTRELIQQTFAAKANVLPPLASIFNIREVPAPLAPSRIIEIATCTATAATVTDGADFESGNTTITNTTITLHQLSKQFGFTSAELQSGITVESVLSKAIEDFTGDIVDAIMAPVTTANYSTALTVGEAAFTEADLQTLFSSVASRERKILLSTPYFSKIRVSWTPPGAVIHEFSRWSGAGANIVGLACDPAGLVVVHSTPNQTAVARSPITIQTVAVPGLNIKCQFSSWATPGTRSLRCALICHVGSAVGIAGSLKLLKSQ